MMNVNVVVGSTPVADNMVTNMNKNMATYLTHFLSTMGMNEDFVKR